ncbi:MAG TPA: hypothetical protein VJ846_10005, partial [Sphingomicrobium sp.]|nr:hypothetical protein [Sphingomicrobium sp.]
MRFRVDDRKAEPCVGQQETQIANRTNDVLTSRTYDVLVTEPGHAVDPLQPPRYVPARPSDSVNSLAPDKS